MRRYLLAIVSSLLFAAIFACVPSTAHALEKQYYWDGPDQIVIKHPFFSYKGGGGEDGDSATFVLDRNSRYPFRFVTSDTFGGKRINGAGICTYTQLYFDIEPDGNGNWRTATSYDYGDGAESNNGGVAVESSSIKDGGGFAGLFGNKPCEKMFVSATGGAPTGAWQDLASNVHDAVGDLNQPFTISGEHGDDASIGALEDQLDRMYNRESTRFKHRVCGIAPQSTYVPAPVANGNLPPGTLVSPRSNCETEANNAYFKIWSYCKTAAHDVPDKRQRLDVIKTCLREQSGVGLNESLVNQTEFVEISYSDGESCTIRFIGWIICPTSRFLASITDVAFNSLTDFLVIRPLGRGEPAGDALYSAWSLVNNISNAIFIIAFMVIIFSQVTGAGLSNYGIKRLLPRLILTAIFVNISYYVCVIAVDLSNIAGTSLKDIIATLEPDAVNKPSSWSEEVENILVFSAGATGVGLVLLTGSVVAMFPLLVGAAIALLVAVIMMIGRYAIILILIMLAPIAIVSSLLPNTQKWYNQWLKLFMSMLLLFPMIAILYGGSQVAGILVLNSSLSTSTGDITLQLFGLAIMALPLAITPVLMKLSGGVLNRFGGVVSNRGFFGKTKERADNYAQRKRAASDVKALNRFGANKRGGLAGLRDGMTQRKYLRKAKHGLNQNELNNSYSNYISGYASGAEGSGGDKTNMAKKGAKKAMDWANSKGLTDKTYTPTTKGEAFAQSLAKGGGSVAGVRANAINLQAHIHAEEVKAARLSTAVQTASSDLNQLRNLATDSTQNEAIRQAAIEMVLESGSIDEINAVVKSSKSMTGNQRRATIKGVSSGSVAASAGYYGHPAATRAIRDGLVSSNESFTQHIVAPSINSGEFSAESIGSMQSGALNEVHTALESAHVTSEAAINSVAAAARTAQSSSSIQSKAHGTAAATEALDKLARYR